MTYDPRLTPARPDLAALRLKNNITAENYAEGVDYQVIESAAPVRKNPRSDAPLLTEALFGERVTVYEEHEGWVWAQLKTDGYVGYLPDHALSPVIHNATHRVSALRTYIYPAANMKMPPLDLISLNSQICAVGEQGDFTSLATGGFIYSDHLTPVGTALDDFVTIAEALKGTPYLWGGKRSHGLDCSGLLQISLNACGTPALRDSDMLQEQLGAEIPLNDDLSGLQRGDLVFWQGHCGIMCDDTCIVHCNGHHMACVIEPLKVTRKRIAHLYADITMIKRLADYAP